MARRKRQFLEDDDSDSSAGEDNDFVDPNYDANDPDARAERELFENPYKRKRTHKDGKEDAIYGVFASSDEDEGRGEGSSRKGGKRSDWTKAPTFTTGAKVDSDKAMDVDEVMKEASSSSGSGSDADADGDYDDEEYSDAEDVRGDSMTRPSKEQSPRVQEEEPEEAEERPRFGGLGLGASKAGIGIGVSKAGLGTGKGGIGSSSRSNAPSAFSGFSKSGSSTFNLSSVTETPPTASPASEADRATPETLDVPTAFGKQARLQRAFVREDTGSGSSTPKPVNISAAERAHFNKISGTFGARMLEKMGWQAGTGLGTAGEGIVTPVESKLRPKGMGLAFKGFKEKTEQAKAEARRRGEVVSDDEEEARPRKGRKPKGQPQEKSDVWKKPKKTKKKIEHKTYEQIVAEAGQEAASGIGQIIDATGATVSTLSNAPYNAGTNIPLV